MRTMERFTAARDTHRSALQSNVVASRGDRLVLEVKSSERQMVPGVIHDVSASGQTVFIEPFQVVNTTNEWRQAAIESEKEEERVLRKFSRAVAAHGEDAMVSLQAAANLDAAVARGRLSLKIGGVRPSTDLDSASIEDVSLSLIEARHPLLGDEAVPISVRLDAMRRGPRHHRTQHRRQNGRHQDARTYGAHASNWNPDSSARSVCVARIRRRLR